MTDDDLDFTVADDETAASRTELIEEAARELDAVGGQLGPGKKHGTAEADIAAEFAEDDARLQLPSVTRLDVSKLAPDAPVRMTDLLEQWRFYWVTFPVSLWTRPGRGFNQLQFKAEFNPDDEETSRPRTHDALPSQEYVDLVKANATVKVGVGGKLKFGVQLPPVDLTAGGVPVQADAAAKADLALDAGVVFGPLDYTVRVPKVQRSNLQLDHVRWRLEGSRMVETQDPGLRLILKVPVRTSRLQIRAAMRARRYVNTFDGTFIDALARAGEKFVYFFKRGAPIGDMSRWDLSELL